MNEQIDIAVDLGVVAKPLPEIMTLLQLVKVAPAPPRQIIEGILHQGCKMILSGTSKSNKSWRLRFAREVDLRSNPLYLKRDFISS